MLILEQLLTKAESSIGECACLNNEEHGVVLLDTYSGYPVTDFGTDPSKHWYRIGEPDEFSEFTFDPRGYNDPQMTGGRSTGYASGQYAFSKPDHDRISVPAPSHPLQLCKGVSPTATYRDEPLGFRMVRNFQEAAISMMRFAEGKERGYTGDSREDTARKLSQALGKSTTELLPLMESAINDWRIHKQVHPMNILLSRLGYNGIEFVDACGWAGNDGTYGNVRFPPITYVGKLVCMKPSSHGRRLRLSQGCLDRITGGKQA